MRSLLLALVAVAFFFGCQSEPEKPLTPEEALRQYQSHIDKNEFEEAKALSTPSGQEWLSELAAIIASEQSDSTVLETRFLSLSCAGEGDTLLCSCVLEDQYEKYPAEYRLIRIDGQWRVDAPEDEIIIENDIIEGVPDSLLEEYLEDEIIEQ